MTSRFLASDQNMTRQTFPNARTFCSPRLQLFLHQQLNITNRTGFTITMTETFCSNILLHELWNVFHDVDKLFIVNSLWNYAIMMLSNIICILGTNIVRKWPQLWVWANWLVSALCQGPRAQFIYTYYICSFNLVGHIWKCEQYNKHISRKCTVYWKYGRLKKRRGKKLLSTCHSLQYWNIFNQTIINGICLQHI